MTVTQKDIASHLGMSRQIVGQALSGHPRVAKETRRRVQAAARDLGYSAQSNREARALIARRYGKRIKNNAVALVLPPVEIDSSARRHPFLMSLLDGVEIEANKRAYDISLCRLRDQLPPRIIVDGYVDGVVCTTAPPELLESCRRLSIPVVVLVTKHDEAYSIMPDDRHGMELATRHLIELGHTNIAYLSTQLASYNASLRFEGYKDALRAAGLKKQPSLIENTLPGPHEANGGLQRLLKRRGDFTGLICYNDSIALDAMSTLNKRGIRVPDDISVVGFDALPTENTSSPPLTSVFFNRMQMGRRAVELIDGWTTESKEPVDEPYRPGLEMMPVDLVIGDSTAPVKRPHRHATT